MERGGSGWCLRGVEGRTNIGSSATNCYTTPLLQIHQIHVRENYVERFKRGERKAFVNSSVHHLMMRQSTNLLNINPVTPSVHNGP